MLSYGSSVADHNYCLFEAESDIHTSDETAALVRVGAWAVSLHRCAAQPAL